MISQSTSNNLKHVKHGEYEIQMFNTRLRRTNSPYGLDSSHHHIISYHMNNKSNSFNLFLKRSLRGLAIAT